MSHKKEINLNNHITYSAQAILLRSRQQKWCKKHLTFRYVLQRKRFVTIHYVIWLYALMPMLLCEALALGTPSVFYRHKANNALNLL